nr:hypothetical protein Iba_chr01cCG13230 [Ipomoea batatas]GMD96955.1 hypothetical protein Iba_scaffold427298CG0010 [Ipomoea batatas]GMD96958.1 hypothetical protein Iba_scaffold427298CG0020 [Ipomoea batatas]
MPVRRRSGSATLRQTAAGVSRIGRLFGRRQLRLAFSKWAGSPAEGDNDSSSRSVSDGVVWVYNPRRRQRGSDLRGSDLMGFASRIISFAFPVSFHSLHFNIFR